MIKKMKKGLAVLAVVAMAAGSLTGCSSKIDCEETVATIGGEEVSMGVASMYVRYQQAQMYYMYGVYYGMTDIFDQIYDTETYETYGEIMKGDLLDSFRNLLILRDHADDYGITLSEEEWAEIDTAAAAFIEANGEEVIESIGTCQEDVAELMSLYAYQIKVREAMLADVDREVSDEEAAQSKLTYVRFSLAGTETDEEGNTIPLTEEEMEAINDKAEAVLVKIRTQDDVAAADMEALAMEVDESLSAVEYTYDDEETYLDADVLAAVEGLKEGELVDEVVMASDGSALYVVRFDSELDRDATDAEKENIIGQREQEVYQEMLDTWVEETDFQIVEKVWDELSLNDSQVFTFAEEEEAADETTEETADDAAEESAE